MYPGTWIALAPVKAQTKAHSYRFRDGTVRVAAWNGRADVASIAFRGVAVPSAAMVERLLARLRAAGYREVVTNAVGPGLSLPLVDAGFTVRGRLHLLQRDLAEVPERSGRTRRATRADRGEVVAVDAAAFDELWRFDALALREAARATPRAHTRVAPVEGPVRGYALFGRAGTGGYVQRLAVAPDAQGHGIGRALLGDGLAWLRHRGASSVLVNTQDDNDRALRLYLRAGFTRLPVGLCVLGRAL
jgi:ribosomal protein S18 acetylase RimI-like enzyme